jgi:hypothetical protein
MIQHKRLKESTQLLLFLLISCFCSAQKITIDNKSDFPVEIEYPHKKIEIGVNQKQTINEKNGIKNLSILYKNNKKYSCVPKSSRIFEYKSKKRYG